MKVKYVFDKISKRFISFKHHPLTKQNPSKFQLRIDLTKTQQPDVATNTVQYTEELIQLVLAAKNSINFGTKN